MSTRRTSFWLMIALCITLGALSQAYIAYQAVAQPQTVRSGQQVKRIAVMPFFKGRCDPNIKGNLDCPVSELFFDPNKVFPDSDRILTGHVQKALQKRHGQEVIPLAKVMEVYEGIPKDGEKETLRTLGQGLGKALEANFIVVGTVWRYRKRIEDSEGGETPASVAFAISLIDVATGKILWKRNFDESQRPLSDNVLDARAFFKKGAKWLSADELAGYGVNEIFETFPL